jgi:hypothetical protein
MVLRNGRSHLLQATTRGARVLASPPTYICPRPGQKDAHHLPCPDFSLNPSPSSTSLPSWILPARPTSLKWRRRPSYATPWRRTRREMPSISNSRLRPLISQSTPIRRPGESYGRSTIVCCLCLLSSIFLLSLIEAIVSGNDSLTGVARQHH